MNTKSNILNPQSEISNPNSTSTVFIIDDDLSVRTSLSRLLRSVGYDVAVFASAREFMDHPHLVPSQSAISNLQSTSGCVVLDIRMPGLSGLDLQEELLAKTDYCMPIIFITGHGDIPMSVNALKKGAVDFLVKPVDQKDLLAAVGAAIEKDIVARRKYVEEAEAKARMQTLTPREREVLALVITGKLNKQIADELGLAEITVKVHRGIVMKKMGVKSVAALVRKSECAHRSVS
ncbi:MAG: response regulator transcription factor [Kiritimatiellae bacterium]|nr:response regulator transcription factor [Kiritimatiellia bacterium]